MKVTGVDSNHFLVVIGIVLLTVMTRSDTGSACEGWHPRHVSRTWAGDGCVTQARSQGGHDPP